MADRFGSGIVLLVVEDDARTLTELTRILERHTDMEIIGAETPPQALDLAAARRPDLALLDIRLPGMDGLTLLDHLRKEIPDLLALVMTGFREEQTARQSRERGAVDFLEKPLDLPYLLVVLRQQTRECLLRREIRATLARLQRVLDRSGDGFALEGSGGSLLASNPLGRELLPGASRDTCGRSERTGRVYEYMAASEAGEVLHHWRDVTDTLEAERGRAYRHMGRLLAHELMNPLTPMRLWLQDIQAQPERDPAFEEFCRRGIGVVLAQVERLASLVGRFRVLGGEGPLAPGPVDLARKLRETSESLASLARSNGVDLLVSAPETAMVRADAAALDTILFNLTKNALEAQAGREGRVLIGLDISKGQSEVQISDQAGGFAPDRQARLFTPYLSTKPGGTGLGLLICRDLLSRMGSALEVENRPGEGVTFRFSLPAGFVKDAARQAETGNEIRK